MPAGLRSRRAIWPFATRCFEVRIRCIMLSCHGERCGQPLANTPITVQWLHLSDFLTFATAAEGGPIGCHCPLSRMPSYTRRPSPHSQGSWTCSPSIRPATENTRAPQRSVADSNGANDLRPGRNAIEQVPPIVIGLRPLRKALDRHNHTRKRYSGRRGGNPTDDSCHLLTSQVPDRNDETPRPDGDSDHYPQEQGPGIDHRVT